MSCKFALYNPRATSEKNDEGGNERKSSRPVETKERRGGRIGERIQRGREYRTIVYQRLKQTHRRRWLWSAGLIYRVRRPRPRPNGILYPFPLPASAGASLRENWYPWKALYTGRRGGFTAVLRPRFRLSRQTCAARRPRCRHRYEDNIRRGGKNSSRGKDSEKGGIYELVGVRTPATNLVRRIGDREYVRSFVIVVFKNGDEDVHLDDTNRTPVISLVSPLRSYIVLFTLVHSRDS